MNSTLNRYARLKPMSAKKLARQPERRRCLAAVRKRSGGRCEARTPACTTWGCDGHEKLKRSQGGGTTDVNNVLWVCRMCHIWIGHNEAEAVKLGLLKRRNAAKS